MHTKAEGTIMTAWASIQNSHAFFLLFLLLLFKKKEKEKKSVCCYMTQVDFLPLSVSAVT